MASPGRETQEDPKQQKRSFQRLFVALPEDPNRRLDALAEVNRSFRRALANQLRPVVRALLQEAPPPDEQGRREMASRLNHVLRDAGLAVVNPESGHAATVVAEPYRLVLQSRLATTGRQTRSQNTKKLPPLDLVEYIRQEPIRTWREAVDRDSSPPSPSR